MQGILLFGFIIILLIAVLGQKYAEKKEKFKTLEIRVEKLEEQVKKLSQ